MPIEFYYSGPNEPNDPMEKRAFLDLARVIDQSTFRDKHVVLIAQARLGNLAILDGLLFCENLPVILEFKHCYEKFTGTDRYTVWKTDKNVRVYGGSAENPYQQALRNRKAWLENGLASLSVGAGMWSLLQTWVLFYPRLHPESQLLTPNGGESWLALKGSNEVPELLTRTNPKWQPSPAVVRDALHPLLKLRRWDSLHQAWQQRRMGLLKAINLKTGVLLETRPLYAFSNLVIGRHEPWVDWQLGADNKLGISGRHVRVETFDNTVRIYDLGSTHGTLCRGQALGAAGEIWRAGDEVILAQRVKLVWQAESKPANSGPPAPTLPPIL